MSRSSVRFAFALACTLATVAPLAHAQRPVSMVLNSGFAPDPRVVSGTSGGPVDASDVDQNCRGWITRRPNFFVVTQTGLPFLRVFVQSDADTTMMIRNPGGTQTWCADDTYGLNPGLDLPALPPGRYEVYIGSYAQGNAAAYQLYFTENNAVTPDNLNAPPPQGVPQGYLPANPQQPYLYNPNQNPNQPYIQSPPGQQPFIQQPPPPANNAPVPLHPDATPVAGHIAMHGHVTTPHLQTSHTGGAVQVNGMQGRGECVGYTTDAPTYAMNLSEDQPFLRMFVTSAVNTALVVRFPDGTFHCNDDSFGTPSPSIEGRYPAGDYQIWVSADQPNVSRPFRLTITPTNTQHP